MKLRFSRKLLFASGLLLAFAAELYKEESGVESSMSDDDYYLALSDYIATQCELSPIERLARQLASDPKLSNDIFGPYDTFLATLDDAAQRKHLKNLSFEDAADDEVYNRLRQVSRTFRDAMNDLFFKESSKLADLIRRYGLL